MERLRRDRLAGGTWSDCHAIFWVGGGLGLVLPLFAHDASIEYRLSSEECDRTLRSVLKDGAVVNKVEEIESPKNGEEIQKYFYCCFRAFLLLLSLLGGLSLVRRLENTVSKV